MSTKIKFLFSKLFTKFPCSIAQLSRSPDLLDDQRRWHGDELDDRNGEDES